MDDKKLKNELGKYLLDISKLILGGVVLATIIKIEDVNRLVILAAGLIVSIGFAWLGFIYLKRN